MDSDLTYNKELKVIQVARREQQRLDQERYIQDISDLSRKYNIVPKEKASLDELVSMITMVLEEGKNGASAIKSYAESHSKGDTWRKDVAQSKATSLFKPALKEFGEHIVVLAMKENNVYVEKDILNNTVTGALTKLSKQQQVSKIIDDLREEVATLKGSLANKQAGKDWKPEATRLKGTGMSIRDISEQLGVGKTSVGVYLKEMKAV